jgi:hypothetical protein
MGEKKIRLEVITSQAIEDDFLLKMEQAIPEYKYTMLSGVYGRGYSVPKLGNAIWPQENTQFIVYCSESDAEIILGIVKEIRAEYTGEGIACYRSEAEEL